ncbi:MAG: hypothetical protein ASARMPRED_008134 [Alectoria sarmentosa]|nr:MAG: hypothetical protein ASARMPRED_008134 [Alectoria sarmentosa]
MLEEGQANLAQRSLQVPFPPKPPIQCVYTTKDASDVAATDEALIFTHGAGGTLQSDAMANFTHGFASHSRQSSILCFQGNMNLKSRVKMFSEVIASDLNVKTPGCLGGRSMGARAAVMAVTKNSSHLVLVSYPLHTAKETRDQLLLDLPASIKVIFVCGDRDEMCDLERLEEVRRKMNCKTWRVVVQDADHGMNVKPKAGTQEVGRKTGDVVAMWLKASDTNSREGKIVWNADEETAQWSGWLLNDDAQIRPSSGIVVKRTSGGKRKGDSTVHDPETRLTRSMTIASASPMLTAAALSVTIVSCTIVYALKTAERPFASSLLGVHVSNHNEEEMHLSTELNSTELSFTVSDTQSEKYLDVPLYDPTLYPCPPKTSKPPPRGRISWLPPLKFQVPAETGHPALQRPDQRTPALSQTNLLRTLSSFPSTLSSFSSKSRCSTMKSSTSSRPGVPAIPGRYLHKSHSLRNGGSPPRPGSRPAMPPADFWMYARAAQQKQNDLECSQIVWPDTPHEMRARAHSEGAARRNPSIRQYPLLPASPEKAVLRPNMNKENTMPVAKETRYEDLRKGARIAKVVDFGRLDGHGRKDSRTLVKMRQPWDEEPRGERRRANS